MTRRVPMATYQGLLSSASKVTINVAMPEPTNSGLPSDGLLSLGAVFSASRCVARNCGITSGSWRRDAQRQVRRAAVV